MKYFLLLTLFAFYHSLFVLAPHTDYSSCHSSYYNYYYYFYSSNGTLCCYRYSYRNPYHTTYYVYCPYYFTYAPAAPATTSISNYCNTYYYSYYYSSSCCYKYVTAYNPYYRSNYYYTTRDCSTNTTPAPPSGTCNTYYYSSYYGTTCCNFISYYYSRYPYYSQYCPPKYTLENLCSSSCCTANVPVYNGSDVFYYSQYYCPYEEDIDYFCGNFCGMAIIFGLVGSCSCICGLGFAIAFFVFFGLLMNDKVRKHRNNSTYIVEHQTPTQLSDGLQGHTNEYRQEWEQREDPPPEFHGYTYDPNPVNVPDTVPYPHQVTGATNTPVIFEPTAPTYSEAKEPLKTNECF